MNMIANGILALAEFPDERRKLVQDPARWSRGLEEIIRYVSPAYRPDEEAYIEWEPERVMHQSPLPGRMQGLPSHSLPAATQAERAEYRSMTMRMAYIAQDRPDLPFASKELARQMQSPTK